MGIWSETRANPMKIVSNCITPLKTLGKNSKGRQIHLFYLPTLGRISKPVLKARKFSIYVYIRLVNGRNIHLVEVGNKHYAWKTCI